MLSRICNRGVVKLIWKRANSSSTNKMGTSLGNHPLAPMVETVDNTVTATATAFAQQSKGPLRVKPSWSWRDACLLTQTFIIGHIYVSMVHSANEAEKVAESWAKIFGGKD